MSRTRIHRNGPAEGDLFDNALSVVVVIFGYLFFISLGLFGVWELSAYLFGPVLGPTVASVAIPLILIGAPILYVSFSPRMAWLRRALRWTWMQAREIGEAVLYRAADALYWISGPIRRWMADRF
ncbi:hypothetical protein HHS34_005545 [Acidithiobacillus montserratensis]|uniref:Uncharacterized protein n=1 Tax=Acidithiobacillus montserratensis TaxID=2729135 RepID=A0ACD5HIB4_9PROT|nr:hypothetical protein [Acidithiobacillus montserratensis]MBU2747858.1 hypothetical protein [Acidithiobacillus montserratensis]